MKRKLLILVLLFVSCSTVMAQQQQIPKETLRTTGKIIGLFNQGYYVELDSGQKWTIFLPDNVQYVEVLGQAEPRWLQRGSYISFAGLFNSKGEVQSPIKDMQVFQPTKDTKLGVQLDGIAGANKQLFGDDKAEPAEQSARYLVSGRLMNLKDGKMTVSGPGFQTTVPLDEKASIRVKMHNPALARVGDKVELNAWYYTPRAQLMQAKATSLKVTAAVKFGYVEAKEEKDAADEDKDGKKPEKQE
ncbi:MAG: hypothetical protein CMJ79_11330 [Planctomycetaceae bacterium]|nr:hypothetical protein [Planctomycetaceae bacterium]|tara:strand:- start:963 stop:1697 length:735 start_codon:yes stop_codon:yes gene_type:complete